MSAYLWIMAAGSALVFALYGLRCARARRVPGLRRPWLTALLLLIGKFLRFLVWNLILGAI